MNKRDKLHKLITDIFPKATIWNITDDGEIDLSRYEEEQGNIRLFCCSNLWSGHPSVFEKLKKCSDILGANNFTIRDNSGNQWVELHYRLTEKEKTTAEIQKLEQRIKELKRK